MSAESVFVPGFRRVKKGRKNEKDHVRSQGVDVLLDGIAGVVSVGHGVLQTGLGRRIGRMGRREQILRKRQSCRGNDFLQSAQGVETSADRCHDKRRRLEDASIAWRNPSAGKILRCAGGPRSRGRLRVGRSDIREDDARKDGQGRVSDDFVVVCVFQRESRRQQRYVQVRHAVSEPVGRRYAAYRGLVAGRV